MKALSGLGSGLIMTLFVIGLLGPYMVAFLIAVGLCAWAWSYLKRLRVVLLPPEVK